ncbi:MAG: hypothetical protein AB7H96_07300 [Vicinamibacterales bacterium]
MRPVFSGLRRTVCAMCLLQGLAAGVAAQGIQRTPDGHPDIQGLWVNNTATPLDRPKEANGRAAFTEQEALDYQQRYQLDRTLALSRNRSFELDAAADLDTYEPGQLLPGRRTSMIVDPLDGLVPALTPEAQQRLTARNRHLEEHYAENPEDLRPAERCLIVANTYVPPLMPAFYNNTLQIVQTRDAVVFMSEQIHDARVVSLTRRTHLPAGIQRWAGDSIGQWEGNTLVVDTTNFSPRTTFRGSGTGLHLIERFTLKDAGTLRYEFTVDDPASFTRPWTARSEITRTEGPMYEYACHEANYSMGYILSGARYQEKNGAP